MDLSWRLLRLLFAVVGSFAGPLHAQRPELICSGEQGMANCRIPHAQLFYARNRCPLFVALGGHEHRLMWL